MNREALLILFAISLILALGVTALHLTGVIDLSGDKKVKKIQVTDENYKNIEKGHFKLVKIWEGEGAQILEIELNGHRFYTNPGIPLIHTPNCPACIQ